MDSRLIKPKASLLPKALLLKDYLLDDLSSCSSNGFKSFPRRQCCTSSVRILIEMDLKKKQQTKNNFFNFNKIPSKSALAAFQSVISAVKRLPFGGGNTLEKKKVKRSILPRKLSMRILRDGSFWKRKSNPKEIERLKSFDQLLNEDSEPSDISNSSITTTMTSDFTASSSGNSPSEVNLNLPEVRNDAVEVVKKGDVSTDSTTSSDSGDSTNSSTKKQWSVSDEKEQFSPVSVLDCPFRDDEEVSSPFQHKHSPMEDQTKKKLMEKIQRFGCLPQIEPLNLAKRFALLPNSDNKSNVSPLPHSTDEKAISDVEEEEEEEQEEDELENQAEQKALDLLHQMEHTLPSYGLKVLKADQKLLLDFFREKIIAQKTGNSFDEELLDEAENWIKGNKPRELFLGWEVPRNRQVYIEDMEKGNEWKSLCQENREVALEFEADIFAGMLNDLLLDISSIAIAH